MLHAMPVKRTVDVARARAACVHGDSGAGMVLVREVCLPAEASALKLGGSEMQREAAKDVSMSMGL